MPRTEWMILADLSFEEACAYIENAAKLGSKPGLERVRKLCNNLGNPEDSLRFIHIAGTNGKGSVAAMTASALARCGLKTGMYYSPALTGPRDHFAINGRMISEEDYASAVSAVAVANSNLPDSATQFELETAAAFWYFCQKRCDVVVLECGMGGRDDATNIVRNKICAVITSVSFDHMQYLGNTLSEIATVKAGIITGDYPVIALDSGEDVTAAVKDRCSKTGSPLHLVSEPYPDIETGLLGSFQKENAAIAYKTLCVIRDDHLITKCDLTDDAIRAGIAKTVWPFRFEKINDLPEVYVDGAHNERAAVKLSETIRDYLPDRKIILVMGMFSDKEYEKVVRLLAPAAHMIFTVKTPNNPRALGADELAKCAKRHCKYVTACKSIEEAARLSTQQAEELSNKEPSAVIACGSLSYLNDFKEAVAARV